MKLLYLHQYFKTPDMAGGTRSFEFARRLVKSGHEVHIISSWTEPTDQVGWFEQNIEGIHVHWLPNLYSNHMSFAERIKAFSRFAFEAGRRARAVGGDVVFGTSTPLTIAIPGVRTAKKLRVPFVFEVRDLWPEMPIATGALRHPLLKAIARRLERYAYFNADHIVALSPTMRDGVLKVRSDVDISVIPNSCDLDLFDFPKLSAGSFVDQHPELKGVPIVSYAGTFGQVNG
ncbi:MAG: glycosyltransferase family 4 protein, partial [Bacteroides sp.]|nr:glycosyltransferase family 4 protein [Bacteroides sp.]